MIGDRMREAADVLFRLAVKSTPPPWIPPQRGETVMSAPVELIVAEAPREATRVYIATVHPGVMLHIVEAMERMAERADEIEGDFFDPHVAASVVASNVTGWEAMSRAVDEILGGKS